MKFRLKCCRYVSAIAAFWKEKQSVGAYCQLQKMPNYLNKEEFLLGLKVTSSWQQQVARAAVFLLFPTVVHEKCILHFHVLCSVFRCRPLPPSSKKETFLPAGEIFIAIQETGSSIKRVSGVVYSRTLQKQTCTSTYVTSSDNLFKDKHHNYVSRCFQLQESFLFLRVSHSFSEDLTTFLPQLSHFSSLFHNRCKLFQEKLLLKCDYAQVVSFMSLNEAV